MPETLIPLISAAEILGVQIPFTDTQLKQAYRRAAKRSHPDAKGSHEAFIAVNESYELLKNYIGVSIPITVPSYPPRPSPPSYSAKKRKQTLSKEEKLQRRITKIRNRFQRNWKAVFECAYHKSAKGINLKDIGRELDDWIISNIPEYFEPVWFYQALFTGNAGKAKKEKYRGFLILIAPCNYWNDKFDWAQRYFVLEFGHKFIL